MKNVFARTCNGLIAVVALFALATCIALSACSTAKQVPADFTDGYAAADFSQLNSKEAVEPHKGELVWLEATLGDIIDVELSSAGTVWMSIATDADGNEWCIILDADDLYDSADAKAQFSALAGHKAVITGGILGFSSVYERPTIVTVKLFDEDTGTIVESKLGTAQYGAGA